MALNGDTKAFLSLLKVADELPRGKQEQEQKPIEIYYNGVSEKALKAMMALDEL